MRRLSMAKVRSLCYAVTSVHTWSPAKEQSMRIFGLSVVVSSLAFAAVPETASDADVLKRFGILGTLAVDCDAPYAETNPHLVYAVDEKGHATRTLKKGS